MKKNGNRASVAVETTNVTEALTTIKAAVGTENPINKDDKAGAKLADKELDLMPWILERVAAIENYLRRDFDVAAVLDNLNSFQSEQKQLDELRPIVAHLENSITVRRVELKNDFAELYKAAKDTKDKNDAMGFIYEKMKPLYARITSAAETKMAEKALEKEALKGVQLAAKEAFIAAKTTKTVKKAE